MFLGESIPTTPTVGSTYFSQDNFQKDRKKPS